MKKLYLISVLIFIVLYTTGQGPNRIMQDISGKDNSTVTEQSGMGLTAVISQEGNLNRALQQQIGENHELSLIQSGYANQVEIIQQGVAHLSQVEQKGDDNKIFHRQEGKLNVGEIIQEGNGNIAWLSQYRNDNSAFISQVGFENLTEIVQEGRSDNISVIISGDLNKVVITLKKSKKNKIDITQSGYENSATIYLEEGSQLNNVILEQQGTGNIATNFRGKGEIPGDIAYSGILINGDYNTASIYQQGYMNRAGMSICGDRNVANIVQH